VQRFGELHWYRLLAPAPKRNLLERFDMKNSFTPTKFTLFFEIDKINSFHQLRAAFRHNKREIQKELGANSHIDASKVRLNYSLIKTKPTTDLLQEMHDSIELYEEATGKRIRRDAVLALEAVFSVPVGRVDFDFDIKGFFTDCLAWLKQQMPSAIVMTADVHLDEANPHMHVILSCVTPTKLIGSLLKGNREKYHERNDDFFHQVASHYGLSLPPTKLYKSDREKLAKVSISHIESTCDPMTKSPHYSLIRSMIQQNPVPFATNLGIPIQTTAKKMRTVVQIMTSKGKGSQQLGAV